MTRRIDCCGCCYKWAILIVEQPLDSHRWVTKEPQQADHVDYHCNRMDCKECLSIEGNSRLRAVVAAGSCRGAFRAYQFPHNYYDYHFDLQWSSIE